MADAVGKTGIISFHRIGGDIHIHGIRPVPVGDQTRNGGLVNEQGHFITDN